MGRVAALIVALVAAVLLLIAGTAAGVVSAMFGGGGYGSGCAATVTAPGAVPAGLTAEQARNAGVIMAVGERMRVPGRGWVVAVVTALQESNLINLGNLGDANDHDSLGLFQQRPSQGWGTPEQIMYPDYAATKFYERLLTVPGWERLPVTEAAQAVQQSAYPDAYAKHEPRASATVAAYAGGTLPTCDGGPIAPSGWGRPVAGTVGSGFRTSDRPGHDGVDIMAPKGTVLRAASAGVVVRVRCNIGGNSWDAPFGPGMPCDVDGTPTTGGCGWYAEVRHAADVVTRYCHMVRQPNVRVGQSVTAGQPIGYVGSSGNSSGPHLHFEIHTGYPAHEGNAVDPVSFMTQKGVRL
ncbi:M23 family metallopeptidase [Salinispora arenicola]|uniref:M23 family metallopeptidase n=1 Tax=Salinispora arenicola TaxID=168697 RepID=UPI0003683AF4|nr:M23 family metallopeptidase [Salinispora arenicola]